MARMVVEQHGYRFEIDTMDWYRFDSAENCAHKIEEYVNSWSEEETKAIHEAMNAVQDGTSSAAQDGLVDVVLQRAEDERRRVFEEEDWASFPSSGHNCGIAAI